ncbi:MAG: MarR family transcriptional regulator [Deltaproteobacteria bacterium]|nr:MarR family transcriptional regulator [Deltaproteobacteria bacterium]
MSDQTLTALKDAHAFRLGRINRLLRRHLISVVAKVDPAISPEQFVLILRLAESDGLYQGDLVDPELDDRPNITRQIQGLRTRGLVRAEADPEDRRRKRLFLTQDGHHLFSRLAPHVVENRLALFGSLPSADLAAFERVLTHLEEALS